MNWYHLACAKELSSLFTVHALITGVLLRYVEIFLILCIPIWTQNTWYMFFASPLSCQCCIPLGSYSCNMKTSTLNRGNVSHKKRAKMHITGWSNDHAVILSQACFFFFLKKILVRSCVLYKSRKQQCGLGVYAPQMHKSPAFSFINNFFNWQILILQRCYQNKILTCSSKYAANFELHLSRLSYFSLVRRVHCKTSVLITICSILSLGWLFTFRSIFAVLPTFWWSLLARCCRLWMQVFYYYLIMLYPVQI